jgi:hypothetical protein
MLPLVEIPPFVKKYAEGYQDLFSSEQFESILDATCRSYNTSHGKYSHVY